MAETVALSIANRLWGVTAGDLCAVGCKSATEHAEPCGYLAILTEFHKLEADRAHWTKLCEEATNRRIAESQALAAVTSKRDQWKALAASLAMKLNRHGLNLDETDKRAIDLALEGDPTDPGKTDG